MTGTVTDRWDQAFFHFTLEDLAPGEERRVWYEVDAEISRCVYYILPEKVGSLRSIPRDLKAEYTIDGERLQMNDPYMQNAIEEAIGDEQNAYWIVRSIFEYVNDRVEYERVGGWDTAPNILKRGTGQCSEYSFVFMAMARGAGIPARFCAGVVERGDEASIKGGPPWQPRDTRTGTRWTEVSRRGFRRWSRRRP
jgi:transglutaminase-like putative cysteine protease